MRSLLGLVAYASGRLDLFDPRAWWA